MKYSEIALFLLAADVIDKYALDLMRQKTLMGLFVHLIQNFQL